MPSVRQSRPFVEQHKIPPKSQSFRPVSRIDKAKLMLDWDPESDFENYPLHLGWCRRQS